MDTNILTLIIAIGGWGIIILQILIGYWERNNFHNDEILLNILGYFTDDAQKRSTGISLVKGLIKTNKKYHLVIVPLLVNQLVYLLLQYECKMKYIIMEERNTVRIYFLLKELLATNNSLFHTEICEVLDAIQRRLEGIEKSSIDIPNSTLKIWEKEIESALL